ncbi:hypothetical protein GCM10011513_12650 [Franconibacter daqui]|nr:hypothetical protein GCM10011513_12650 [Franconibacter daqui]
MRAGMAKRAAASPLSRFTGKKETQVANARMNETLYRPATLPSLAKMLAEGLSALRQPDMRAAWSPHARPSFNNC